MRIPWRRRKRSVAHQLPPYVPSLPPLEEAIEEGLGLADLVSRMDVKNAIIVAALQQNRPFDPAEYIPVARQALARMREELDESASRVAEERKSAELLRGEANDAHDYRDADVENLRFRERTYRTVSQRLREQGHDEEFLAGLVEQARQDAWKEVSGHIERALLDPWRRFEHDPSYEEGKSERLSEFARDLDRLVARHLPEY